MDPWTVPLSAYVCMPESSYTLRSIANGRFTILEAVRSFDEHRFVNFILKKVHGPDSIVRLPTLAKQVAKEMKLDTRDGRDKKVIWQ